VEGDASQRAQCRMVEISKGLLRQRQRAADLSESLGLVAWGSSISTRRFGMVFGRLVRESARIRSAGSPALGLAWLAAGRADFAYFELSFHEWDVAAGLFMCRQQGLRVRHERIDDIDHLLVAPPHLFERLQALTLWH